MAAPATVQDRLLTGLSAAVNANEPVFAWTVDEGRAAAQTEPDKDPLE